MTDQLEEPSARFSPRRFGTGALVATLVVGLALGIGGSLTLSHRHEHAGQGDAQASAEAKQRWVCPMHPTVVQDHPGDCPICGMKLVLQKPGGGAAGAGAPGERKIAFYRSPMDPKQISHQPR